MTKSGNYIKRTNVYELSGTQFWDLGGWTSEAIRSAGAVATAYVCLLFVCLFVCIFFCFVVVISELWSSIVLLALLVLTN